MWILIHIFFVIFFLFSMANITRWKKSTRSQHSFHFPPCEEHEQNEKWNESKHLILTCALVRFTRSAIQPFYGSSFEQIINRHFTIENKLCIRNLMVCANGFWDARVNVISYKKRTNVLSAALRVNHWEIRATVIHHLLPPHLSLQWQKENCPNGKFTRWHRLKLKMHTDFYDNDTNAFARSAIAKQSQYRTTHCAHNRTKWRKCFSQLYWFYHKSKSISAKLQWINAEERHSINQVCVVRNESC